MYRLCTAWLCREKDWTKRQSNDVSGSATVRFKAPETETSGERRVSIHRGLVNPGAQRAGAELHGGYSVRGTSRPKSPLRPALSVTHAKLMLTRE